GCSDRLSTENCTQSTTSAFVQFWEEMGSKSCYASPAHPQSNGQVERANATVLNGLKMRAFDRLRGQARQWIEELPAVLWSIRTTPSRATGRRRSSWCMARTQFYRRNSPSGHLAQINTR